ncbi:hypothetical protein HZB02_02425 [Candidatus Woesearchaeota archaeon]|nr:hypothetical protein [Candidatus Woesearchaeota archaeon]
MTEKQDSRKDMLLKDMDATLGDLETVLSQPHPVVQRSRWKKAVLGVMSSLAIAAGIFYAGGRALVTEVIQHPATYQNDWTMRTIGDFYAPLFGIPTITPTPSATPIPTTTPQPRRRPKKNTPTPEPTATATLTPTNTSTIQPTLTPTLIPTSTPTATPSHTMTASPKNTCTPTPYPTNTRRPTKTPTATLTPTSTKIPIPTKTPTRTPTPKPYPLFFYQTGCSWEKVNEILSWNQSVVLYNVSTCLNKPITIDLYVLPGHTLEIEEGVTLNFGEQGSLNVGGTLSAIGKKGREIMFKGGDLFFYGVGSNNSQLEYCVISHGSGRKQFTARGSPEVVPVQKATIGGGLLLWRSSPTFRHCTIEHNAAGYGAGAYLMDSLALFQYTTFRNNAATSNGGGLCVVGGDPHFIMNTITKNTASRGGGLELFRSSVNGKALPNNNSITLNQATEGAGIYRFDNQSPHEKPIELNSNNYLCIDGKCTLVKP